MYVMFTTDEGHAYGEMLGQYQKELEGWIRTQSMRHRADGAGEAGRKKYTDRKRKQTRQLHTYINTELNRLLRTEKPEAIYIPKTLTILLICGREDISKKGLCKSAGSSL